MNAQQTKKLAMLKRINAFVTATPPAPPLNPPPAPLAQLVTLLQTAIANAESAAAIQGSGNSKVTTSQRAALRHTLRARYLIPLRHVARVLAKTTPGLGGIVQLPKKVASEAALIAAAQATATDVAPYQADFIARGLAPDFLDQLNAAIAAVQQAAAASTVAKRQKVTSTADLKAALDDGSDTAISIGHVVQTACDQDKVNGPSIRDAWEHIQHVRRASAAPVPILAPSTP